MLSSMFPIWTVRLIACTGGFAFLLVIDTAKWTPVLLRTVACGTVLAVVLSLDNVFRNNVYGRSDPLSFSLLGYSFLLVVSDALLAVARSISPGQFDLLLVFKLVVPAFIFSIILFLLIFWVLRAHTRFQRAQQTAVRKYIQELRAKTANVDEAVWQALEELGAETIEPDVFINKFVNKEPKEERRIKYLKLVKNLTKATISPEEDQSKLLVTEKRPRNSARFWYIVTAVFGTTGALYFFFVR